MVSFVEDTKLSWLPPVLAASLLLLAADAPAQQTPEVFGRRPTGADVAAEIRNAAADQLYAVELGVGRPTSVGEVRAVAEQLRIPRALAIVEYSYAAGQGRGLVILGLGEMYAAGDAKEHSECSALATIGLAIPSDCGDVYVHNDQMEAGTLLAVPE